MNASKMVTMGLGAAALGSFGAGRAIGDDQTLLGRNGEFFTGLGAGIAGGFALKAGIGKLNLGARLNSTAAGAKLQALESAAAARGTKGKAALIAAKLGAATVLGTIPSYALLSATSGDKRVLGQGHDFWAGSVWGLGAVAAGKTLVPLAKAADNGPLALGWLASDFVALGADAKLNGDTRARRAEPH